ncbi:DUF4267 domain-containing protein [Plasmodiophora brassicae]
MSVSEIAPEAIFWFGVAGAGAAALKHLLAPHRSLEGLTPVALRRDDKDHVVLSPEAHWWGGYAFSAMNMGLCATGVWAGVKSSPVAKQGYLLGVAVLFDAFAVSWLFRGHMTGKPDYVKQGLKVAALGTLFSVGFFMMPN